MSISDYQLERIIEDIHNSIEPSSQFYGRLLNWKGNDSFWHYGIGLSDSKIFDTGRGFKPFGSHYVKAKFVKGVDEIAFPSDKTIQRLIHALKRFQGWEYGLLGWNCEHLARLVATNRPISYEVRKQPWPIPDLNHRGKHPHAKKDFARYLSETAPELLSRENLSEQISAAT